MNRDGGVGKEEREEEEKNEGKRSGRGVEDKKEEEELEDSGRGSRRSWWMVTFADFEDDVFLQRCSSLDT